MRNVLEAIQPQERDQIKNFILPPIETGIRVNVRSVAQSMGLEIDPQDQVYKALEAMKRKGVIGESQQLLGIYSLISKQDYDPFWVSQGSYTAYLNYELPNGNFEHTTLNVLKHETPDKIMEIVEAGMKRHLSTLYPDVQKIQSNFVGLYRFGSEADDRPGVQAQIILNANGYEWTSISRGKDASDALLNALVDGYKAYVLALYQDY